MAAPGAAPSAAPGVAADLRAALAALYTNRAASADAVEFRHDGAAVDVASAFVPLATWVDREGAKYRRNTEESLYVEVSVQQRGVRGPRVAQPGA